jgi:hypothetical protein
MLVGYMRVSSDSDRQSTHLQRDALRAAGVDPRHLFEDHASGAKDDRAGLARALEFVRPGDVLVVWKLDRLGRSLSHLLAIVTSLKEVKFQQRYEKRRGVLHTKKPATANIQIRSHEPRRFRGSHAFTPDADGAYRSRNTFLSSFPTLVLGKASTKTIRSGTQ